MTEVDKHTCVNEMTSPKVSISSLSPNVKQDLNSKSEGGRDTREVIMRVAGCRIILIRRMSDLSGTVLCTYLTWHGDSTVPTLLQ